MLISLMLGGLISTAGSNSVKKPNIHAQFSKDFNNSLDSLAECIKLIPKPYER